MIGVAVDDSAFVSPEAFTVWCGWVLDSIVAIDRSQIRRGLVGDIYESGVRYREDPKGIQTFGDAVTCKRQGYGHCAWLCCWRAGWLQEHGEPAILSIKWTFPYFHVRVRRADGRIEDVSRVLGMKV